MTKTLLKSKIKRKLKYKSKYTNKLRILIPHRVILVAKKKEVWTPLLVAKITAWPVNSLYIRKMHN